MNCAAANQVDLVDYLYTINFEPVKIRGNNYWYLSPFRNEKEPSFKVDRKLNVWYDHGQGSGGSLVDFVMSYFNCDTSAALDKINSYNKRPQVRLKSATAGTHQQDANDLFSNKSISKSEAAKENKRPLFHLHTNSLADHQDAAETAIEIIAAKSPITTPSLCRYLKQRNIDKTVADNYCHEVTFEFSHKEKEHVVIGFKNNAGGFELRNDFFKLSSSPKYITYIQNDVRNNEENLMANMTQKLSEVNLEMLTSKATQPGSTTDAQQSTKNIKSICVFEGFFDFLSYQTIHRNQQSHPTDFLILNSLAFFERSLLLMEKYASIHLYLDHDDAAKKSLSMAINRSVKYNDESKLYEGYKDLNDWLMHFGKLDKKVSIKNSRGLTSR